MSASSDILYCLAAVNPSAQPAELYIYWYIYILDPLYALIAYIQKNHIKTGYVFWIETFFSTNKPVCVHILCTCSENGPKLRPDCCKSEKNKWRMRGNRKTSYVEKCRLFIIIITAVKIYGIVSYNNIIIIIFYLHRCVDVKIRCTGIAFLSFVARMALRYTKTIWCIYIYIYINVYYIEFILICMHTMSYSALAVLP